MGYFHIVARVHRQDALLSTHPLAPRVWSAFRRAFPDALAAVLMPNHLHVIAPSTDAEAARLSAGAALSGIRRSVQGSGLRWQKLDLPPGIPDMHHLKRQIRYVALNPCRSGFVRDPLEWLWSTHREIAGAAVDPWMSGGRLAAALGDDAPNFAARWHRYVSGDPTVHVIGTRFPQAARPKDASEHSLGVLLAAAAAAHRAPAERLFRRGPARRTFLALAHASGWHDLSRLGRAVDASRRTALRHGRLGAAPAAAWLCLGDARLRGGHAEHTNSHAHLLRQRSRISLDCPQCGQPTQMVAASRLDGRL